LKDKAFAVVVGLAVVLSIVGIVQALAVNPASGTTGDSASTAQTIAYRDTSGGASFGYVGHDSFVLATLITKVPSAVGQSVYCSDCSPKKLLVSTGTSAGNWADPAGGTFK